MEMRTTCARVSHGVAAGTTHTYADGGAAACGGATTPSQGALPVGDRSRGRCQPGVGHALEAAPRGRGTAGTEAPSTARSAGAAHGGPVGRGAGAARAWGARGRVRNRALDAPTHRHRDRADLRGA